MVLLLFGGPRILGLPFSTKARLVLDKMELEMTFTHRFFQFIIIRLSALHARDKNASLQTRSVGDGRALKDSRLGRKVTFFLRRRRFFFDDALDDDDDHAT